MALDSKQKRGSAISLSIPHRQWLAEPDGTLINTDRMSLVKFCSAVAPGGGAPAAGNLSTRMIFIPAFSHGLSPITGG